MPFRRHYGGRRRSVKLPVTSRQVTPKKDKKCDACKGVIQAGELSIQLRLRKNLAGPCTCCHRNLRKTKRYHLNCAPLDANAAMGYVAPGAQTGSFSSGQGAYSGATPPPPPPRSAPMPPPRPVTPQETMMAAFAAFEQAIITRCQRVPGAKTKELADAFKRYQGIKARALRPGTEAEGETAARLALIQILKTL